MNKRVVQTALWFLCVCLAANAQITYIGHRGASYDAPENTLASVNLAWKMDVDAVEIDIHLSKDNQIIVIHDDNTKRITGKDHAVIDTNSDVLRKLDVGSHKDSKFKGEKLPLLEEVIATIPKGKKLVVELKSSDNVLPKMAQILNNNDKSSQLVFISFDKEAIIKVKQSYPQNPCYWLCNNKEFLLANIRSVADAGLDGINLKYNIIDEQTMELSRKYGLDMITYTVNDPEEAKRLIRLGVKQITTDRPEWLKNQMNNRISMVNHRGANRLAPENTYASAQKALELGVACMEVDVRRSKDGVYYNIHDHTLNRTTNGSGLVSETESSVIDNLDAGGWFAHEFKGQRVPRMYDYLKWIKGKAKVYFDMKDYRLDEFIPMVYELGMENDCFFWFSTWKEAAEFRKRYPQLTLKVNANSVEALDSLKRLYNPQIIECPVRALSETFIRACREKDMKVMPIVTGFEIEAFRIAIENEVDMINLDCPEIFSNMMKNNGVFDGYKLIAHRGGIVENRYDEFEPASIQAAIDRGYFMLEIDVRETKDGVLILNHDDSFERFYNDTRKIRDLTWAEIRQLKPVRGNHRPMSLEELAKMCAGKVELMIDIKEAEPSAEFLDKLDKILTEYNFFPGAYFINENIVRERFWGKAKFSFRVPEENMIREKIARGEDVACHYFLFDAGTRLNSSLIKACQAAYITIVPSVNFGHYRYEDAYRGAKRDIEFLQKCGVIEFQIDSDFDDWF